LCLCSKNDEADVIEVFQQRPEMPLKREHLVAWRINWQPKSENLRALAQELQLGLESFIFVDDNPIECAEVEAQCPEVLTLQLPAEVERIPKFLAHVWAFDQLKVTEEDRERTALYQQNAEREQFRQAAPTLADFLAGLELTIEISELTPDHVERVAQLTQRTNQFNVTTIRRTEAEIQRLCQSAELECLTVIVRDRFGDYGLVGVILFAGQPNALKVDTFLLSCRVLGRGVEHRMLARLGELAQARGAAFIEVPYHPTPKNKPALDFLNSVGGDFKEVSEDGWLFRFPVEKIKTRP
jgi:FkbH-like protein